MVRLKKNEVRCRATVHFQGGVRPGHVVIVDATDPWMASKISHERGPLVPLDPNWEPPAAKAAPVDAPEASQDGPGGDAASTLPDGPSPEGA